MSVELRRRENDGEYRHDLAEPLTETIDVQAAHEPRHLAELFTADQAASVFSRWVEHQPVPEGYTLRLIADMCGREPPSGKDRRTARCATGIDRSAPPTSTPAATSTETGWRSGARPMLARHQAAVIVPLMIVGLSAA